MKKTDIKHLSLRINTEKLEKFRYVCEYDGRSANSQSLVYIRETIKEFETEHGKLIHLTKMIKSLIILKKICVINIKYGKIVFVKKTTIIY